MASAPVYAGSTRPAYATLTGAPGVGFRGGSVATNIVDIAAGGANGSRIERVLLKHSGTNGAACTAALSVVLFIYDGTNRRLIGEVSFGASGDYAAVGTPSAGVSTAGVTVPFLEGLPLPSSSYKLQGVINGWVDTDDDFTACAFVADA